MGQKRRTLTVAEAEAASAARQAELSSILDDQEDLLRNIFIHSREGISLIDSDYNLLLVNPVMEKNHAASKPLLGKKCHLVYQRREQPCDFCPLKRAFATGQTVEGMIPGTNNRWLSLQAVPIFSKRTGRVLAVIEYVHDISDRRQSELELANERDLLHTLMDCIPDFIYFKDRSCRYTRINMAEAVNLGLRNPEAAVGKTVFDFFPPELAKQSYQDEQRIIRTGQPLINKIERTKDGDQWVLTTKVPVFEKHGMVTGLVGISRNITERKRAEEELQRSLEKLRRSMEGAIEAMALTVEIRDPYTAGHQRRVSQLACAIAEEMGLSEGQIDGIRLASAIHDIGKIYIPAEILSKPGCITETELSMIRTHPQVGYDILKTIEFPWPIAQIVLQHHKRLDGSGYPADLPDGDILLEARILSVADVVEAMSSHRPYRPALGIDLALEEVSTKRGLLYDETVVAVCLKLFNEKHFAFKEAANPALG